MRVANLGALDLGRQLRRPGDGGPWRVVLTSGETKNGLPNEAAWPEELRAPLERYLARWRPVLLGGAGSGPGTAATARRWV